MVKLEVEGLCWIPVEESAGTYLRVPLADGSEITISGTTADGREVSSRHAVAGHGGWFAAWDDFNDSFVEIYRSASEGLSYAADTSALASAVLACAREHGGGLVLKDESMPSHSSEHGQDS